MYQVPKSMPFKKELGGRNKEIFRIKMNQTEKKEKKRMMHLTGSKFFGGFPFHSWKASRTK